jgi:hypothetical protein
MGVKGRAVDGRDPAIHRRGGAVDRDQLRGEALAVRVRRRLEKQALLVAGDGDADMLNVNKHVMPGRAAFHFVSHRTQNEADRYGGRVGRHAAFNLKLHREVFNDECVRCHGYAASFSSWL